MLWATPADWVMSELLLRTLRKSLSEVEVCCRAEERRAETWSFMELDIMQAALTCCPVTETPTLTLLRSEPVTMVVLPETVVSWEAPQTADWVCRILLM